MCDTFLFHLKQTKDEIKTRLFGQYIYIGNQCRDRDMWLDAPAMCSLSFLSGIVTCVGLWIPVCLGR